MSPFDHSDEEELLEECRERVEADVETKFSVVDRFLLAVIDKHPSRLQRRNERLKNAKIALLGDAEPPKEKGINKIDDMRLLMKMLAQYVFERRDLYNGEDFVSARLDEGSSIRSLALDAVRLEPSHLQHSIAERIRKKFLEEFFSEDEKGNKFLREGVRPYILAARYGGDLFRDEFVYCEWNDLLSALKIELPPYEDNSEF